MRTTARKASIVVLLSLFLTPLFAVGAISFFWSDFGVAHAPPPLAPGWGIDRTEEDRLIKEGAISPPPADVNVVSLAAEKVREIMVNKNMQIIDAARHFVHANSVHGDGLYFERHARDHRQVLWDMINVYGGEEGALVPGLQCANHATVMAHILQELGLEFRFIRAGSARHESFQDHVLLEVLNPETNLWEMHDPNYGVYYVNWTGRRASVADIAAASNLYLMVRPCDNTRCSWRWTRAFWLYRSQYYSAFERQGHGIVKFNVRRFSPEHLYTVGDQKIDFINAFKTSITPSDAEIVVSYH